MLLADIFSGLPRWAFRKNFKIISEGAIYRARWEDRIEFWELRIVARAKNKAKCGVWPISKEKRARDWMSRTFFKARFFRGLRTLRRSSADILARWRPLMRDTGGKGLRVGAPGPSDPV